MGGKWMLISVLKVRYIGIEKNSKTALWNKIGWTGTSRLNTWSVINFCDECTSCF